MNVKNIKNTLQFLKNRFHTQTIFYQDSNQKQLYLRDFII